MKEKGSYVIPRAKFSKNIKYIYKMFNYRTLANVYKNISYHVCILITVPHPPIVIKHPIVYYTYFDA